MSDKRLHPHVVGAFVTVLAASLQGLDRFPADERSSTTALSLVDHVLRDHRFDPPLTQAQKAQLQKLCLQLRHAVSSVPMWTGVPNPGQSKH